MLMPFPGFCPLTGSILEPKSLPDVQISVLSSSRPALVAGSQAAGAVLSSLLSPAAWSTTSFSDVAKSHLCQIQRGSRSGTKEKDI